MFGRPTFAVALLNMALASPAFAQSVETYRVEANSTRNLDLRLCGREIEVKANGDGDTDLDFFLKNASGNVIFRDTDDTDLMIARVEQTSGCANYKLNIVNLGNVYNRFTVSLRTLVQSAQPSGTSSDGRDRRVAIHNHTAEAFNNIYFSNTASGVWGPDRLGTSVMPARTNRTFNMDDNTGACRFDVKVITRSGQEYVRRNIDACTLSTLEFGTEVSH